MASSPRDVFAPSLFEPVINSSDSDEDLNNCNAEFSLYQAIEKDAWIGNVTR